MMIFNLDYVFVDPFEKELVYVGSSKVDGAGRGVFARKALKKGTLVSFVNGIKMDFLESKMNAQQCLQGYDPYLEVSPQRALHSNGIWAHI